MILTSPSGALVPGVNTLLAIFRVYADPADDITFTTAAGDQLIITMNAACTTPGVANMVLKDQVGTLLSTAVEAADACTAGNKTFSTWTTSLVITKNTTKKLYLYGDTTGASTVGDSLQAFINDTDANVTWGINNVGAYATGSITARGKIYANALSR